MVVTNNYDAINRLGQALGFTGRTGREDKLAVGQRVADDDAASLSISAKARQAQEKDILAVAEENILASESSFMDIARADEMIRQANSNILYQADDAVKAQSAQDAGTVMGLLQ